MSSLSKRNFVLIIPFLILILLTVSSCGDTINKISESDSQLSPENRIGGGFFGTRLQATNIIGSGSHNSNAALKARMSRLI